MNSNSIDTKLIFLISQPRSGSTLLQQILSSHREIYTMPEPWIMLNPLYALKEKGIQAEYNAFLAQQALKDFLKTIPKGEDTYYYLLHNMYMALYEQALSGTGKTFFLDKTPRYYFIVPELKRIFPKAKYIILLRNPLAVLASILNTWVNGDWLRLSKYTYDLFEAPRLLTDGINHLENKAITVCYEELVNNPDKIIKEVCKFLDVDFVPGMIEYGKDALPHSNFGDPVNVHLHSKPVRNYVDKWIDEFSSRQKKHLALSYLDFLGEGMLNRLGYSLNTDFHTDLIP